MSGVWSLLNSFWIQDTLRKKCYRNEGRHFRYFAFSFTWKWDIHFTLNVFPSFIQKHTSDEKRSGNEPESSDKDTLNSEDGQTWIKQEDREVDRSLVGE